MSSDVSVQQTIVRGRWVVANPAARDLGLIEDGAVLIQSDRVAGVGPFDEIRKRAVTAPVLGDQRHLVVPGLVNTHHHGRGLTGLQLGVLDDYLEPWLIDWRGIKPLDAYLDTLHASMQLIRSGVTTVLHSGVARDMGRYAADTAAHLRAYDDAGLRVSYALQTLDQHLFTHEDDDDFLGRIPAALRREVEDVVAEVGPATPDDFESLFLRLLGDYAGHERIRIMASPIGPDWCSDRLLRRVGALARAARTGIHLHCLESPFQRAWASEGTDGGAIERLRRLGILGPDVSLGHSVWLDRDQATLCADTGTTVCHNASSNLRLRSGVMPLDGLLDAGVNVSIGTDGITLNDDDDMLQELRLVAKLQRLPRGVTRTWAPSSADVLRMATANGGRPTLWGDEIGSLGRGSRADLVVIDLDAAKGVYLDDGIDPVDALLYRAKQQHVNTVLIGGSVVYAQGQFPAIDEAEVVGRLRAIATEQPRPAMVRWANTMAKLRPYVETHYATWPADGNRSSFAVNAAAFAPTATP